MATTTNLGLTLPTVGADDDTWGGINNTVHNGVDAVFKADGTGTSVGVKVGSGKTLNALDGTVVLGDAGLTLKDTADPTKIAAFQCSGITAGQTRTYTLPDASGTISLGSTNSTRQILTSGTAATYTTPAGCKQIKVKIVGGGGGALGSGTSGGAGGTGGTSTFNSINAAGGSPGVLYFPGAGGTGGSGSANYRIAGAPGGNPYGLNLGSGNEIPVGGSGGGVGGGLPTNGAGGSGVANTGGGGAGAGFVASRAVAANYSGGGGSGETAYLLISTPSATYTYTVGAGGASGTAGGGSGTAGGAGGSGYIIVDEFY